jgi:hypothetical protein
MNTRNYSIKKHAQGRAQSKEPKKPTKFPVVTQGASVLSSQFSVNLNDNKSGNRQ